VIKDEDEFEEVILAGLNGTVFIKTDKNNDVTLGIAPGHDIDGPPATSIVLTWRQLNTMVDFLKMYTTSEGDHVVRG